MKISEIIYYNSPIFLQNVFVSIYGYKLFQQRYEGKFLIYLEKIRKNVHLNRDEIYKLQMNKLRKIIKYSYDNVPFYTEEFRKIGVSPKDIKNLEDIKILPIVTKSLLKQQPEKFISKVCKKIMLSLPGLKIGQVFR
jgi:phenylacetate-CoA ligase